MRTLSTAPSAVKHDFKHDFLTRGRWIWVVLLAILLVLGLAQRAAGKPGAAELAADGGLECDRTAILPILAELDAL
jgi:hypothetical protein